MKRSSSLLLLTALACLTPTAPAPADDEIEYVETFALAKDRTEVLGQLIPGTEEYYFYHALHYQNTGQTKQLASLLDKWRKRVKSSELRNLIDRRERLLAYDSDPKATLEWLRNELGVHFSHQRSPEPGQKPNLPTALDPELISRKAYLQRATARQDNLNGLQDSALDWLLRDGGVELTSGRRRALLSRLDRPDYDNLVELVVADLRTKESRGFGEFNIHRNLLQSQLDALVDLKPDLRTNSNFIYAYLTKLAPSADADPNNPEVRQQYLERMWAYVKDLPPAHNSLKANILYALLDHQRKAGEYDRALFETYVKLPRPMPYMQPRYLQSDPVRRFHVNLGQDFSAATRCRPVGDDTALVREYLLHFLVDQDDVAPWTEWIRNTYVKPIMAEAKIVSGAADPERWASMLSPSAYQQLKDRVDIDLAVTNPRQFDVDDEVTLAVDIKNVDKLLVKVYEVNAFNVYLATQREVSTGLPLDGLVAGSQQQYEYNETPFLRVRREFTFPELTDKRGVWMIELIGGGRSSRALVRKGGLHFLSRQGVAGTVLSILDENDEPVPDATAWLAGREYKADENGGITIPYSTQPGRRPIILRTPDGFASLAHFQHPAEVYSLDVGFFVDREALRVGGEATLLIRPDFRVNGVAAPLKLLEQVKLTITSTNLDGVSTTAEVPDFELQADKESEYRFAVPPRLASLTFRLDAQVEQVSTGNKITLSSNATRSVNGIDKADPTFELHLSRMDGHAVVEVLGKNGERLSDRAVRFVFHHRDFNGAHGLSLKSDEAGRIDLGMLPGIVRVTASADGTNEISWDIAAGEDAHSRPAVLQAVEGETLHVPHIGAPELSRDQYSLLAVRGGTFTTDQFDKLSLAGGFLLIKDLAAGDYSLKIKHENRVIPIRIAAGKMVGRFAAGKRRILETAHQLPLQITAVADDNGDLLVKLANAEDGTRVHVLVARFKPAFPLHGALGPAYDPPIVAITRPTFRNIYLSGRDIGDEYRYILDRRDQPTFPGNMLERPGLLLNPWELRDTDTGKQQAATGGEYDDESGGAPAAEEMAEAQQQAAQHQLDDPSNLDFLKNAGVVLANLTPDDDGNIRIPKEQLSDRQDVHIVAVGPLDMVFRHVSLADAGAKFRDLRLAKTLDLAKHFTEQKEVSLLNTGEQLNIADVRAAEMQEYDTLASVYSLYMTRSSNSPLAEFAFVLDWDSLDDDAQHAKYSKYASHELSFYLSRKDPEFFAAVILPYLKNKKDKTFLDHYLLDDDVSGYLDPWRYSRLNMAERVLLADRLGGEELASTKRHLADLFAQLPPDPAAVENEFLTSLRGRSLSLDKKSGLLNHKLATLSDERSDFFADGAVSRFESGNARGAVAGRPSVPASRSAPPPVAKRPMSRDKLAELEAEGEESYRRLAREKSKELKAVRRSYMDYGYFGGGGAGFGRIAGEARDLERRQNVRGFYRKMPAVKEWAENNYYHIPIEQQLADRIAINAFWRDYAAHLADNPDGPFLSKNVAAPTSNFSEMMLALAVLDLPIKADEPEITTDAAALTLKAASPTIVFHKQIQEAPISDDKTPVLVGQNFFRHGDRYEQVDGEKRDKYVTEEFLPGVVYGCQVVVTNPTSATQKLDILVQIPEKAMPVLGSKPTQSMAVQLGPYATQKLEYYFYFPRTGDYAHYPVQVARDEALAAWAEPFTFHVVKQLSRIDTASWEYLSQWGTPAEVTNFLEQNNIERIDLSRIAWRMRDVDFFTNTLNLLSKRHVYNPVLWSYSVYHNKLDRIQQYLRTNDDFLHRFGDLIDCTLVTVDPVERHWIQHLEYSPLVNARAHRLGRDRRIVNTAFRNQYHRLMNVLRYKAELTEEDKLDVVYYLFLQDRIAEGLSWFDSVDAEKLPTALQMDYLRCYVAFYREQPDQAEEIAKRYADYPVDKWQERFAGVLSQVDEIRGGQVAESGRDEDQRETAQDELASTEPALATKVESGKVRITYQNLEQVTINYYEMDVEFLFSSNPFVESEADRFGVIKPNRSDVVELPKGSETHSVDIPEEFSGRNVLVEVLGSGRRTAQAYYANNLKVQLVEQYGRLQVRDAKLNKPLSKVYVKVYARTPEGTRFFKDGYTDLRGKFDYTSLNTDDIGNVSEFAVLVMSPDHGAVVKTAKPPQR
ncbi:hypothetical protein [Aeoliella sp.]|uniref:hypothetical protein n=1 Tax=Aeoliella sp. TaxID=2795800 RepID=UPI003CCC24A0